MEDWDLPPFPSSIRVLFPSLREHRIEVRELEITEEVPVERRNLLLVGEGDGPVAKKECVLVWTGVCIKCVAKREDIACRKRDKRV
jgi:hypothetical protein